MTCHLYFPNDLLKPLRAVDCKYLIGLRFEDVFIVVTVISNKDDIDKVKQTNDRLEIIGTVSDENNKEEGYFNVFYDYINNIPYVVNEGEIIVIMFNPPNFNNLEYFSINPILLQSMGHLETKKSDQDLLHVMNNGYFYQETPCSIADERILDNINLVYKIRLDIDKRHRRTSNKSISLKSLAFFIIKYISYIMQWIIICLIRGINFPIGKYCLTNLHLFRQLDLRLKQINYFPIQFLCYYDKDILYKKNFDLLKKFELPIFNSNLNINNSNYINLYNSLWLIVNDVMIGLTVKKYLLEHQQEIIDWLQYGIDHILFGELYKMISWISFHNPAGFKLNTELSSFIGELFLWSLEFWKSVIFRVIKLIPINYGIPFLLFLCNLGITFLIGILIDAFNVLTIHIYWFYQTSSNIYKKQINVLKSLFQLFRGKKYNTLRNRIDNLNNYELQQLFTVFEVDQLLLGTLLFIVLSLLLPTVFLFYLTFFLLRLMSIMVLNFMENILIIINFSPLFVILLKLKNSKRLQGGITFNYLASNHNQSYLQLQNKSLTYREIFVNYTLLFKKLKNFKTSLLNSFIGGHFIHLHYDYNLKFHYLMLPKNYDQTLIVWKYL